MSLHIHTVIHRTTQHLDVVILQKQVNRLLWEAQKKLHQWLPEWGTRLHQQALLSLQHQSAQYFDELGRCSRNLMEDANDGCYFLLILSIF